MKDDNSTEIEAEAARLRAALERIMDKGKTWAVHHPLERLAQQMYDIAEEALKRK